MKFFTGISDKEGGYYEKTANYNFFSNTFLT